MLSTKNQISLTSIFLLLIVLLLFADSGSSQDLGMRRQSIGMAGSTSVFSNSSTSIISQQSIGQQSAVGTITRNSTELRQGFLQPIVGLEASQKDDQLTVTLFPNPFSTGFTIRFEEKINSQIKIEISDLSGRNIYSESFEQNREINLTLSDIAVGVYIIQITAEGKAFAGQVQKLAL